jgi:hypothetical protein
MGRRIEQSRVGHKDDLVAAKNRTRVAEIDNAAPSGEQGEHQLFPDHPFAKTHFDCLGAAHGYDSLVRAGRRP